LKYGENYKNKHFFSYDTKRVVLTESFFDTLILKNIGMSSVKIKNI